MNTQQISKSDFAKIYKISCDSWKKKLGAISVEQIEAEKITISPILAKEMYSSANDDQKKILEKIIKLPEPQFRKVKTYEDALKLNKEKCTITKADTPDEIALKKLKAITKAINGGQTIDLKFALANTYFGVYAYYDNAGLACVTSTTRVADAASGCGFRLCFYDKESADYAAETFKDLYLQFYF